MVSWTCRCRMVFGLALLATTLPPATAASSVTAADPAWLEQWFATTRFDVPPPAGFLLLPKVARPNAGMRDPWSFEFPPRKPPVPPPFLVSLPITPLSIAFSLPIPLPPIPTLGSQPVLPDVTPLSVHVGEPIILVAQAVAHPNPRAILAAWEVGALSLQIDGVDVDDPRVYWIGPRLARFSESFTYETPSVRRGSFLYRATGKTDWWPDAFVLPDEPSGEQADVYLGGAILRVEGLDVGEHVISWRSELAWTRVLPPGMAIASTETNTLRFSVIP